MIQRSKDLLLNSYSSWAYTISLGTEFWGSGWLILGDAKVAASQHLSIIKRSAEYEGLFWYALLMQQGQKLCNTLLLGKPGIHDKTCQK